MNDSLKKAPNIGKIAAEKLRKINVNNIDELREIGSKQAFLKIKEFEPDICMCFLMGLEGATQNVRWHNLTPEKKKELKEFFNNQK